MVEFALGQIVISKRGKDAGLFYVVSGFERDGRVKLIRPWRFNVSRPKKKNPSHLQATNTIAVELVEWIKAGKDVDRGYFYMVGASTIGGEFAKRSLWAQNSLIPKSPSPGCGEYVKGA